MPTVGPTIQPPPRQDAAVALPAKDHIVTTAASPAASGSGGTKRPIESSVVTESHHGNGQATSVKRRRLSSTGLLALWDCDDVTSRVLSFLTAKDVEGSLKLVCKAMQRACDSPQYWRELLLMYGKPLPNPSSKSSHGNPYEQIYYRNPCVPVDFGTIPEALDKACSRSGSTITLMPGVYSGPLWIRNGSVDVTIQAAKPDVGAALVHCVSQELVREGYGGPLVELNGGDDDAGPKVRLSHLHILHSAPEEDIVGSNVALRATGAGAHLLLDSCTIQSSSGRGIVIYKDASLDMQHTTVHDCAATGVWTYRSESVNVSLCNIIRNGFGSRFMWAGHSGIFAMSDVCVQDSLISSNRHTGLTVLKGGIAHVSGCDITENGEQPLTVLDPLNVRLGNVSEPGVLMEGPIANNTRSRPGHAFGAPTRETTFPSVLQKAMTKKELSRKFQAFRYEAVYTRRGFCIELMNFLHLQSLFD